MTPQAPDGSGVAGRRGIAMVLLLVLITVIGVVWVMGSFLHTRAAMAASQAQAAADAAALGALAHLRTPEYALDGDALLDPLEATGPRATAGRLAALHTVGRAAAGGAYRPRLDSNLENLPEGDVVLGDNAVIVRVRRTDDPMRVLGRTIDVRRAARAVGVPATTIGSGRRTVVDSEITGATGLFPLALVGPPPLRALGAGSKISVRPGIDGEQAQWLNLGVGSTADVVRSLCFLPDDLIDAIGAVRTPRVSVGATLVHSASPGLTPALLRDRVLGRVLIVPFVDRALRVNGFGRIVVEAIATDGSLTIASPPSAVSRNAGSDAEELSSLAPAIFRTPGDAHSGPAPHGVALATALTWSTP